MTTNGVFVTTAKIPTNNQWCKQLVADITGAFNKVTTIIDDVTERFAVGNQEIKNSITEAKNDILLFVTAVEKVVDDAKLQADTNACALKELQLKFDKFQS